MKITFRHIDDPLTPYRAYVDGDLVAATKTLAKAKAAVKAHLKEKEND